MPLQGIGIGNLGTELLNVKPGTCLGLDDRYTVVGLHHSTENTPAPLAHSTYIAKDTRSSHHVTVRVLGKSATVGYAAQNNKSINARLQQLVDAHTHILLPINTFDHNEEHLAFVFDELVGPDLYYLTQIGAQGCGQPANWIQKVFREALQALDILHSGNIVHGMLDPFSFLITYPKINLSSGEAVRNFYYGSSQRAPEHYNFNTTGTGQADTPHNLDFQIKLQNFSKSYSTGGRVPESSKYADIRSLARVMTNMVAGAPEYATPFRSKHKSEEVSGEWLLKEIRSCREIFRDEGEMIEETGAGDFSQDELSIIVDLLMHMLSGDASKCYTARQALQHEFFQVQRPVGEQKDE